MNKTRWKLVLALLLVAFVGVSEAIQAQFRARDPGVRGGPAGAGGPIPGLSADEGEMFTAGLADFSEEEVDEGVGPRFNFVGCKGCHEQPPVGARRGTQLTDLLEAIQAHRSAGNGKLGPSEANAVIDKFNRLDEREKQNLLTFLRSL